MSMPHQHSGHALHSRGTFVLLPEGFLRTRKQLKLIRRKHSQTPKLLEALQRRGLLEGAEESSRTHVLFSELRLRRRLLSAAALQPGAETTSPTALSMRSLPRRSILCARVIRTSEVSYWETPSCRIWVQDLASGEQWIESRTLADVAELSTQIQGIEDAARDDEIAEAALLSASRIIPLSPRREDEHGHHPDREFDLREDDVGSDEDDKWKLEHVLHPEEVAAKEENERKGHLLNYLLLQAGSSHDEATGSDLEGTSSLHSGVGGDSKSNFRREEGIRDGEGEAAVYEAELESLGLDLDFDDDFDGSNEGLSISPDDARFLMSSANPNEAGVQGGLSRRRGSARSGLLSPSPSPTQSSMLSTAWSSSSSSVMPVPTEAQEQTERLLRRVVLARSFFDPTLRLKPRAPPPLLPAASLDPSSSLRSDGGGGGDHAGPTQGKGMRSQQRQGERRAAFRKYARRKQRIAAQATVCVAEWIGGPPLPRQPARDISLSSVVNSLASSPTDFDNNGDAEGRGPAAAAAGAVSSSCEGSDNGAAAGAFLLSATSSLSNTLGMSLPVALTTAQSRADDTGNDQVAAEDVPQAASERQASSTQASSSPQTTTPPRSPSDELIRDIRIYTLGILSLPPLARLISAYISMATQELDAIYSGHGTASDTGGVVVPGGVGAGGATVATSVQSAASSLVSTLFGSLLSSSSSSSSKSTSPATSRSPVPPPPASSSLATAPVSAEDEVNVKNYWGTREEGEVGDEEVKPGEVHTWDPTPKKMVVVRKAKVREGIEIKNPGGGVGSTSLIGTLGKGTAVVVLEEAIATDGTQRSKVRTVLDFENGAQAASRQMVVGWVTSNLLKPTHLPTAGGESFATAGRRRDDEDDDDDDRHAGDDDSGERRGVTPRAAVGMGGGWLLPPSTSYSSFSSSSSSRGSTLSRGGSVRRSGSSSNGEGDADDVRHPQDDDVDDEPHDFDNDGGASARDARLEVFNGTPVVGPQGLEQQLLAELPLATSESGGGGGGMGCCGGGLAGGEVAEGGGDSSGHEVEYGCGDGPVHRLMERLADFMAQTVYLVKEACEGDLLDVVATHSTAPLGRDECEGLVDSGVWRQVEAEVVVPLHAKLSAAIAREVSAEAQRTAGRLRALKALPQEFWSIPEAQRSPTAWAEAVHVLNTVPSAILPSEKVDLLLHAVQTIERLSEQEPAANQRNEKKKKSGAKRLGADDLFPIFVYVLVQSDLWKQGEMVCLRELLSGLANPERQRWSASAYYVATLEAAIEHIKAT